MVTLASLRMASLKYSISSVAQNHSSMGNTWSWLDWHPLLCKKRIRREWVSDLFLKIQESIKTTGKAQNA